MEKIKAFQFDIDGNTFHLETEGYIKVKRGRRREDETVTPEQFAKLLDQKVPVKYDEDGFINFRDDVARVRDFKAMLKEKEKGFGYVEPDFRDALLHGEEVSFNTSRGHSSRVVKDSIKEYILLTFDTTEKEYMMQTLRKKLNMSELASFSNALDEYLQYMFQVYAVKSTEFAKLLDIDTTQMTVEQLKPFAYQHYVDYLTKKYGTDKLIAIGFSEDTKKYIDWVSQHIGDIILPSPQYNHIYPVLYHTLSPMKSMKIVLRAEREVRKNLLANGVGK